MSDKKITRSKLLAEFRSRAAARRASSPLSTPLEVLSAGITRKGGVVTVTLASSAKPLSTVGGASKVFGPSKISIPEFKRLHRP